MIQIFLRSDIISEKDWDNVYKRIQKITNRFPLQLERIESYNGFQKEIDKTHYNLTENEGKEEESLSFWADRMSYSAGFSVKFYKKWEIQKKRSVSGEVKDSSKPIIWDIPEVFDFSGYPPTANGAQIFETYLDTSAVYRYAVLAIGIMIENVLPGRAFLVSLETASKDINNTVKWLEYIFKEKFDTPVYFDKARLLDNLTECYDNKADLVARLDKLYLRQFKKNMEFALQNIAYKPSLEYYAKA